MKKLFLILFGMMFALSMFAQQDSVVFENETALPCYKNIDEVKLAMSEFKRKEILSKMKFQTPKFYKKYRNGQRLNRWGSGFILVGTGYLFTFIYVHIPDTWWWRNPDGLIAIPITAAVMLGGGVTMVCFGQKYKRTAINSFAADIYNGKAHLTQNKFQPEFNLNFSGNSIGFLVNF